MWAYKSWGDSYLECVSVVGFAAIQEHPCESVGGHGSLAVDMIPDSWPFLFGPIPLLYSGHHALSSFGQPHLSAMMFLVTRTEAPKTLS